MTLISFVVPAFRVQGYLRECLDSILGQPETDIEVIAVDDCSPDASGDIIDEYAARDQRVHSVRLPENVGLGPARNIGLDRAVGEYVWFLDGDDWLTPECLTEVAERLRGTRPDVLLVDHVRTHWNDTATRSAMAEVFPESPGVGTFRLRTGRRPCGCCTPRGTGWSAGSSSSTWGCASRPAGTRTSRSATRS